MKPPLPSASTITFANALIPRSTLSTFSAGYGQTQELFRMPHRSDSCRSYNVQMNEPRCPYKRMVSHTIVETSAGIGMNGFRLRLCREILHRCSFG